MTTAASLPITIRQMTKRYGDVHALDHVDLDIRSGEFMTLLGPSGSGKTTLLSVLGGFTRPDHGSLMFGEREVVAMPPHERGVGMVFQNYALFPHMSVADNVGFALRLRGVDRASRAHRVERALEMVRLSGFGKRRVDQLSGGQRQRVALARAIVFEPRILLMDEPLSALDKQLREHMQLELRQLHEALGMTTVYVTHDQREALTMSDRIAVIDRGRIVQLGSPRTIYDRPVNRFVAEFIGESTLLAVNVVQGSVRLGARTLAVGEPPGTDGPRLLMVRPERVQLLASGYANANTAADNQLTAKVRSAVFQGDSLLLHVELEEGSTLSVRTGVREAGQGELRVDSPVTLSLAARDCVLLPTG
jgi:putative spermidine/putrescine transport system ATP-binding protein